MHLDDGAVQRDRLQLDTHYLFSLKVFEHPVQNPLLRPAVHAGIDRVPVAEPGRQPAPLAAVLGHIQDRVQNLEVRDADVAALHRQVRSYAFVLRFCDFHAESVAQIHTLVLTRPRLEIVHEPCIGIIAGAGHEPVSRAVEPPTQRVQHRCNKHDEGSIRAALQIKRRGWLRFPCCRDDREKIG